MCTCQIVAFAMQMWFLCLHLTVFSELFWLEFSLQAKLLCDLTVKPWTWTLKPHKNVRFFCSRHATGKHSCSFTMLILCCRVLRLTAETLIHMFSIISFQISTRTDEDSQLYGPSSVLLKACRNLEEDFSDFPRPSVTLLLLTRCHKCGVGFNKALHTSESGDLKAVWHVLHFLIFILANIARQKRLACCLNPRTPRLSSPTY